MLDGGPRRFASTIQSSLPKGRTKNLVQPDCNLIIRYLLFAKETENGGVKGRKMPFPSFEFNFAPEGSFAWKFGKSPNVGVVENVVHQLCDRRTSKLTVHSLNED